MKQIIESVAKLKVNICGLLRNNAVNSNNKKVEYHFHAPVKFINNPKKELKEKNQQR